MCWTALSYNSFLFGITSDRQKNRITENFVGKYNKTTIYSLKNWKSKADLKPYFKNLKDWQTFLMTLK